MELQDFIRHFAKQLEDTPPEKIQADTNYKELDEWSSVVVLIVTAMIDEEYQVLLTGNDIRSVNTVEELYQKIKALSV